MTGNGARLLKRFRSHEVIALESELGGRALGALAREMLDPHTVIHKREFEARCARWTSLHWRGTRCPLCKDFHDEGEDF